MAVYKPTDCVPSGDSFDALNDRPIFIECKIDTNNAIVNGYSLELFDEDNNHLWSADSGTADYSVQQTDNITLIVDLKRFFDDKFSQYGRGYKNLNTGINGSYLKIPIIYDAQPDIGDYGTFSRNTPPESVLSNGKTYRWKITLYQEMVNGATTISYPLDQIYYDMIMSTGRVIGSTSQRIQTALVADDDDLVSGLVLIDKYIQPVSIDSLEYNPSTPKDWSQEPFNDGIINSGVRSLIENYDDIYGHIYPSQSGDNALSSDQITLDSRNNGFRIYKNGNNPEDLGVSDKVYEIINYPVDEVHARLYASHEDSEFLWSKHNNLYSFEATFIGYDVLEIIEDSVRVWYTTEQGNSGSLDYDQISSTMRIHSITNGFRVSFIYSDSIGDLENGGLYIDATFYPEHAPEWYEGALWQWIDTPANPSQSHWKQVYTTTINPSENGYRPFDSYTSEVPTDLTIYGKERIIFNHMYTGGAYSGSDDDRKYLGSCYNGIFSPDPSAKKVDGKEQWNVTINWYRTTDANTWGLLLNKVVYVENGSTTPPDEVDGDVFLQAGANAEITIGSTSGVLNQTPFMFVSEKPIRLFNTEKRSTKDSNLEPINVGTTNSVYLIKTTELIGEVLSVKINGATVPSNTWSYIVKSQNVFYTPSDIGSRPVTAEVVYKQYREQDYTGVIFYNQALDMYDNVSKGSSIHPNESLVYIKPFVGIEPHMIIKFSDDVDVDLSPIDIINTKYWFVIVRKMLSNPTVRNEFNPDDWKRYNRIKNVDTKYQICSNYRDGDYNEFSLAENPEIAVHVYDSMGNEISSEEHDYLFYEIKTRTFSAEIEYNQTDYILWESCQWDLYTADRMLNKFVAKEFVTSSSEKYDGKLRFVFFGLEDKKYYILRSTIMTNNGGKFSQDTILYAQYSEQSTQIDNSTINFNYDDLCVDINVSISLLNTEDVANSMIRIYKREVWYYENQAKITYGTRFVGESSPWYLISENALAGVVYKDYCVASGHHYEYLVCRDAMVPVDNSDHFVSQEVWAQHLEIEVKYMGWSIIELHNPQEIENGRIVSYTASPKDVWRFKYNVSSGSQVQNVSRSQQDTLGGYPKISVGEKNFMSGSVSALLGREIIPANYRIDHYKYVPERIIEVDNTSEIAPGYWTRSIDDDIYNVGGYREELSRWQYPDKDDHYKPMYVNANTLGFRGLSSNESVNMINAWKNVVYSGNDKLMKDEKGRMFLIHILSNSVEPNDSWTDMPTQISFDWVEVSDVKNISVYENEPNDEIVIDGLRDVVIDPDDEYRRGYVPDSKYLGRNGAIRVRIQNPQYIKGFKNNAFYGCTNIHDVYIDYPNITDINYDGPPVEEDLFDWWCKLDFENEASNPIIASPGDNEEGVRIRKQESNLGAYVLCRILDCSDDLEREQDNSGYIPTKYSVRGYKYLEKVIMKYNTEREITDAGLFEGCVVLQTAELHNVNIAEEMFKGCVSLNDVTFGDVSSISNYAFSGCTGLTSFTIPSGCIRNIGECVFTGCNGLKSITAPFIGDGGEHQYFGYLFGAGNYEEQGDYLPTDGISVSLNTSNNIPDYAFYGCSRLKSVDMSDDIISIGAHAFDGCSRLETITLPYSITNIGEGAFSNMSNKREKRVVYTGGISAWCGITFANDSSNPLMCAHNLYVNNGSESGPELVENLEIPAGVTSLKNYAFCGGTCIQSVVIGSDVNSVGLSVFAECDNIKSITIPFIGDGHGYQYFGYLFGAQSYDGQNEYLPENISVVLNGDFNIPSYTFYGCSNLSVVNTGGWTGSSIGAYAFYECAGLTAFNIPETVSSIGSSVFYGCNNIQSITIPFIGDGDEHQYFGYLFGAGEYNVQNKYLPNKISVVLNSDNNISDYAFYGCGKLSTINIDAWGGSSVGAYAFYKCDGMTEFNISETIRSIGDYAFSMSGLTSVAFEYYDDHSTGAIVGCHVFENCTKLNSAHLRSHFSTTISAYTFAGCSNLESVVLDIDSNQLWSIGDYAFYNCYSLRAFDTSDVGVIGNSAFERSGLSSLTIGTTITSIGTEAFRASKVEVVNIIDRSRQLTIGPDAFAKCVSMLKVVYLGATVDDEIVSIDGWFDIGFENELSNPVYYSENLYYTTGISVSDEQQELNKLCVPNVSVNNYAFYSCKSLTYITFTQGGGAHYKNIGDYAFYNCVNIKSIENMQSSSITSIGDYAFYDMRYYFTNEVESLVLPDHIEYIGRYAFYNLGLNIDISEESNKLYINGYPEIGVNAFLGAKISDVYYKDEEFGVSGWTYITFNNLYANPLYQCGADLYIFGSNSYTKVVDIMFESDINKIPQYAFAGCTIETIGFNGGASVSVDDYAFYHCSELRGDYNEDIPDSISQIGDYAFSGTIVRNVTSNVTSVGVGAFANSSVNYVDLSGFTETSLPANLFKGCSLLSTLKLSGDTMFAASNLSDCINLTILWAHVNIIDNFEYKMNLRNITVYLSDGHHGDIYNVPDNMLKESTSLTNVRIVGTGMTSCAIGKMAFYYCPNLSNISISGVHRIGSYAFAYAPAGTITITPDVSIIYPGAFLHTWSSEDKAYFPSGSVWRITGGPEPLSINTNNYSASDMSQYLRGGYDAAYYSEYLWERTQ